MPAGTGRTCARLRRILVGVIVALTLAAAAGSLEDIRAAYDRGDYATALRLLHPFAEQGDAMAQVGPSFHYADGRGVPQGAHRFCPDCARNEVQPTLPV